jgi:hypothetical protein
MQLVVANIGTAQLTQLKSQNLTPGPLNTSMFMDFLQANFVRWVRACKKLPGAHLTVETQGGFTMAISVLVGAAKSHFFQNLSQKLPANIF